MIFFCKHAIQTLVLLIKLSVEQSTCFVLYKIIDGTDEAIKTLKTTSSQYSNNMTSPQV